VISKPYTLTLTLSLKGEGINGWALTKEPIAPRAFAPVDYSARSGSMLEFSDESIACNF
jgi:hypothetical protein